VAQVGQGQGNALTSSQVAAAATAAASAALSAASASSSSALLDRELISSLRAKLSELEKKVDKQDVRIQLSNQIFSICLYV
jgi:hypothetical protein